MNIKKLFRSFYLDDFANDYIFINNKKYKGQWVYWDAFGNLTDISGEPKSYEIKSTSNDIKFCNFISQIPHLCKKYICSFTGITDKFMTNIYDGDILLVDGTQKVYVHYVDANASFYKFSYEKQTLGELIEPLGKGNYRNRSYEILGNIYRDTNLLDN